MADIVPYDPERQVRLGSVNNGAGTGYGEAYPEPPLQSKSLRDYLSILRRQWWIFLGVTLLATGVTLYRVSKLPTRYQIGATVRLADRRDAVVAGDMPQQRSMIGRETDPLASQIQLLMSRSVSLLAVEMAGLRLKPPAGVAFPDEIDSVKVAEDATAASVMLNFGPASVVAVSGASRAEAPYGAPVSVEGVTLTVTKRPKLSRLPLTVIPVPSASGEAVGGLRAQPRQKTDIVDLSYVGNDPHQAKRMVNAMAEAFAAYSTTNAQQQSTKRRVFLENQLRQTEAQVNAATGAFTSYRSGQRVFSSKTQGSAQEAGLLDIDVKMSQMAAEKRTFESLLAQAQNPDETQNALRILVSSPGMSGNPVVGRAYGQMSMAEQARDSLMTTGAASTNPDVMVINTRITAATAQLLAAVRSQIQSLDAQLGALANLKAQGQTKIASAPAVEAEEAQLQQQVKTVQTVADQLQSELQKAKMAEAVAAGQVEIVDLANNPGHPLSNGVPRKIFMGVLLGLLLGAGASFLIDGMNTSIRKRTDIDRILQVPSLAVIPRFAGGRPKARFALPARTGGKSKGKTRPGKHRPTLVTIADAGSPGAEAYRTLRTNLMFSQAVQALRTVVVTSASPGEGKTTTVGNLGITFAQQNLRVLLVDCDLRRSRLHTAFNLPRGPGLTEMLLGQIDQDDAVKATDMPGLYVLPAGAAPPNPSEMLGGQKMRAALQSLSEAFDLIILDTPPILAASDGAILATLADGVVVVLKAGSTESEAAQQALHQLKAVGARIVGAVLNDPDAKVPLYGSQYTYDYAPSET